MVSANLLGDALQDVLCTNCLRTKLVGELRIFLLGVTPRFGPRDELIDSTSVLGLDVIPRTTFAVAQLDPLLQHWWRSTGIVNQIRFRQEPVEMNTMTTADDNRRPVPPGLLATL
jgi:hypothetical protein